MKTERKFLYLLLVISLISMLYISQASAATTLTISSPANDSVWSWEDPPTSIKWNTVSGAAGYYVTIKNDNTGAYIIQNKYTTSTSYSISGLLPEEIALYKIWVGAVASSSNTGAEAFAGDINYIVIAHEPDITLEGHSDITSAGATLEMSVDADYGVSILDSGFYIGTSSTVSSMTKYSFHDYGNYSATTKGTKYMTIDDLEPDTKYYYRAYAEGEAGETYSSRKYFTTDELPSTETLEVSSSSVSFTWSATTKKTVTVTSSDSYTYKTTYNGVPASAMSGYKYEWLTVTKSGSTLSIVPARANYATTSRSATITITSGSLSKTITVTQAACGETAPSIVFTNSADSTTEAHPDGKDFGTYSTSGDDIMYLYAYVSNVRRLCINVHNVDTNELIRSDVYNPSGSKETIACYTCICYEDGTPLSEGNYIVECWSSNSNVEDDYWSQHCDKVTFYFEVEVPESPVTPTYAPAKAIPSLSGLSNAEKLVTVALSQVGYTETGNNHTVYGAHTGSDGSSWCAPFVSWCADQAGLTDLFGYGIHRTHANPRCIMKSKQYDVVYFRTYDEWTSAHCADDEDFYYFMENASSYSVGSASSYSPQLGDIIFFGTTDETTPWGHVGIIYDYDSKYFYYVDGNGNQGTVLENGPTGNTGVAKWRISRTNSSICAIARPAYSHRVDIEYGDGEFINVISIKYDANGGINPPEEQIGEEGSTFVISNDEPSRDGYIFLGWSEDANADTATYQPGDSVTLNKGIVLYAVWEAETYTITYNGNGGYNVPASQTKTHDEDLELRTTKPSRTGYTFLGWATSASSSVVKYNAGDTYTKNSDIILYAVWEEDVVKLSADIVLPKELIHINEEAFMNCSFTAVCIQSDTKTIGARAFKGCSNLQQIEIPRSVTTIADDAFEGCTKLVIYCSENSTAHEYAEAHSIKYILE